MSFHSVRHIVSHTVRKHRRGELETTPREDDKIMGGQQVRDMVCIVLALVTVVSAALYVQHLFELDADVLYDAGAAIGAHPLSRGFRYILDMVV